VKLQIIILVILLILSVSCRDENEKPVIQSENISFSKYLFPKDSSWYDIKKIYETTLKLETLENGADSIEFRFWIDQQLLPEKNVFVFKYKNNNWIGENIFFKPGFDQDGNSYVNTYIKKHLINLEQNFHLMDILKNYNFFKFPTQRSLNDDAGGCCLDGVVYFYELATKNSYRLCVYSNPQCCEEIKENKAFADFIDEFLSSLPKNESCWPNCSTKE